jgi:hypothetical protein
MSHHVSRALRTGLGAAAALVIAASTLAPRAHATVVLGGSYSLGPPLPPGVSFGPGDVNLPDTQLLLGSGRRAATLTIDGGSQVTMAYLNAWGNGLDTTVARIDGANTRVNLAADGRVNRFAAGNAASSSSVIVSGGAVLDGTYQRERCNSGQACQNVVGAAAGSNGALTVTGAGSEAHFLRFFHVGVLNYNSGTGMRGRDGMGTVKVLDGGLLTTEMVALGAGFFGPNLNGTERGIALATVSGAGSRWVVDGSDLVGGSVRLHAAQDRQSVVNLDISQGGTLHMLASPAGLQTEALLGTGGNVLATVRGPGSTWRIDGDGSNGFLRLAAGSGDAALLIQDGARLDARISSMHIGMGTGRGNLQVSGSGSVVEVPDAYVYVGDPIQSDPAGSGWLRVAQGGLLHARQLEISRYGLLSGSGDIQVGTLINRGTISPGDSPGVLHLSGHWRNEAGARLMLEVEDDGHGGFLIDQLVLDDMPELNALNIEFRFLGRTDPRAFLASGQFDIDRFLVLDGAALPDSAFNAVHFSASSTAFDIHDFSYTASGGAQFTAQEIPLPTTFSLALLALVLVMWPRTASQLTRELLPVMRRVAGFTRTS